jgi:hypothetical protein
MSSNQLSCRSWPYARTESPGIAERCDKQMDLHRNPTDLHPAFTEIDLQLFAGVCLKANSRACRRNQLTPQRCNRAFHRTQTDYYTLLARQLLAAPHRHCRHGDENASTSQSDKPSSFVERDADAQRSL